MLVDPIIFDLLDVVFIIIFRTESLKFQQICTTGKHFRIIGIYHIKVFIVNYTKRVNDVAITDIFNKSNIYEVQKRCSKIMETLIAGLPFGNHLDTLKLLRKTYVCMP